MSNWTSPQLDVIGDTDEVQLSTTRPDGSLRSSVPVWNVRSATISTYGPTADRREAGTAMPSAIPSDTSSPTESTRTSRSPFPAAPRRAPSTRHTASSTAPAAAMSPTLVQRDIAATTLSLTPR